MYVWVGLGSGYCLDEDESLSVLYPIVERPLERNGVKGVRVKIKEDESYSGRKSATIWWGEVGEEAPCAIPDFTGDEQWRRRLYPQWYRMG